MLRARSLVFAVSSFFYATSAALAAGEKPSIAILPFESPNDHSLAEMGPNAVEYFTVNLVKSGKVKVFERKKLDKIMAEHSLNMTGLVDATKVKKTVGNLVPVDFLLSGKVVFLGDAYSITVHLVDLESGELTVADETTFREITGLRVAVKSIADKIAAAAVGEEAKTSASAMFLNTDPKHFYTAAELLTAQLERGLTWDVEGELGDVDSGSKKVTVELKRAPPEVMEGVRLEVFRDEVSGLEKVGEIFVTKHKKGDKKLTAEYYKSPESGDYSLGDKVKSREYKNNVAIGSILDEAEDNDALVKKFRETVIEKLGGSSKVNNPDYDDIGDSLGEITGSADGKKMKKIHKKGVDYVILGKFYGSPGGRRTDFTIYNAFSGKKVFDVKFDTKL
jgi:TolB-like protein